MGIDDDLMMDDSRQEEVENEVEAEGLTYMPNPYRHHRILHEEFDNRCEKCQALRLAAMLKSIWYLPRCLLHGDEL